MNKLLIYSAWLKRGGAERVTVLLAKYMAEHGIECDIVTAHKSDNEYVLPASVGRICLKKLNIFNVRKAVKESGADTVLVMGVANCIYVVPACVGLGVKVVVSERNDPWHCTARPCVRTLSRFLMRFADDFVFQTKDAKNFYSKALGGRGEVIFNPVCTDEIACKRAHRIVSVGRLVAQKNHRVLIKAFSKIAEKHSEFTLDIYGEGPLKGELEKLIAQENLKGRVRLAGNVPDVHRKIRDSAAFVMTSDFEGMPNALAEAMAMGLACICTDCPCGGPKELIDNGKNGILVPVGDVDAVADAMLKIIENKAYAESLAKNATKIKDKLNCDEIGKQWFDFLGGRIKVMQFISSMDCGGAQAVVRDYARFIDKSDFETVVVTTAASTGFYNEKILEKSAIKTYYIGNLLSKATVKFGRKRKLKEIIEKERPDIIHCHLGAVRFLYKIYKNKVPPCPILYTVHSDAKRFFENENIGKYVDIMVKTGKIQLAALHEKMRNELKMRYGGDYPVFENGIDKSLFENKRNKHMSRISLKISADAFVVGHVGRFAPVKNHVFLMKIFSKVLQINPNSYLLLVGDGEMKEVLQRLAENSEFCDRVIFAGEQSDVALFLSAMDVFCMPSLSEGAPLALFEALAAGIRCVVSDSVSENLSCGGVVGISTDESADVWARAVCQCGRECGETHCKDVRKTVKELEIFYKEVIHHGKTNVKL